ncbi:DUF364 domain-containing protein [Eubacteriaceae bacterium ES2]|nr:DUF364 domain-containing protein [Eubacteriaceae bacterium ES2]
MKKNELFTLLQKDFQDLLVAHQLDDEAILITSKSLTPEEAIGITKRKDFPILTGSEVMIQAKFRNSSGQAFTDSPTYFHGSLKEVSQLPIIDNAYNRSIFIATYNALKNELGLATDAIHCKNNGPELCSKHINEFINNHYQNPKILLVGYQPSIIEQLSHNFSLRVLDLNPANVGAERYGINIEHGMDKMEDAIDWADIILCTGSTLCNGSIVSYLNLNKVVFFFGTTISGSASTLNIRRLCFADQVSEC